MEARFNPLFAPIFAIYYVFAFLFHEKLRQIGVRNNPKTVLFLIFSFCNLQQNALHLAAKHLAFCCRLHCVLQQNAIPLESFCFIFCAVPNANITQFSSEINAKTILFYQKHRALPPKTAAHFFLICAVIGVFKPVFLLEHVVI